MYFEIKFISCSSILFLNAYIGGIRARYIFCPLHVSVSYIKMNLQYSFIIFEMSIGQGELPKIKSIRGSGTSYTLKSNVETQKKLRIL